MEESMGKKFKKKTYIFCFDLKNSLNELIFHGHIEEDSRDGHQNAI